MSLCIARLVARHLIRRSDIHSPCLFWLGRGVLVVVVLVLEHGLEAEPASSSRHGGSRSRSGPFHVSRPCPSPAQYDTTSSIKGAIPSPLKAECRLLYCFPGCSACQTPITAHCY